MLIPAVWVCSAAAGGGPWFGRVPQRQTSPGGREPAHEQGLLGCTSIPCWLESLRSPVASCITCCTRVLPAQRDREGGGGGGGCGGASQPASPHMRAAARPPRRQQTALTPAKEPPQLVPKPQLPPHAHGGGGLVHEDSSHHERELEPWHLAAGGAAICEALRAGGAPGMHESHALQAPLCRRRQRVSRGTHPVGEGDVLEVRLAPILLLGEHPRQCHRQLLLQLLGLPGVARYEDGLGNHVWLAARMRVARDRDVGACPAARCVCGGGGRSVRRLHAPSHSSTRTAGLGSALASSLVHAPQGGGRVPSAHPPPK